MSRGGLKGPKYIWCNTQMSIKAEHKLDKGLGPRVHGFQGCCDYKVKLSTLKATYVMNGSKEMKRRVVVGRQGQEVLVCVWRRPQTISTGTPIHGGRRKGTCRRFDTPPDSLPITEFSTSIFCPLHSPHFPKLALKATPSNEKRVWGDFESRTYSI